MDTVPMPTIAGSVWKCFNLNVRLINTCHAGPCRPMQAHAIMSSDSFEIPTELVCPAIFIKAWHPKVAAKVYGRP